MEVRSEGLSCGGHTSLTVANGVYDAIAACPVGSTLVGGGHVLALNAARSPYKPLQNTIGTNSPDISAPDGAGGWRIAAGGYPDFCFFSVALCAE